ncbi:hypothetical protein ACLB2K_012018 [Fragaria x ananassa]
MDMESPLVEHNSSSCIAQRAPITFLLSQTSNPKFSYLIDCSNSFILGESRSNTKTVRAILAFKEDATKGKGSSKKKKNEERVNMMADEYMKNSSNMLDFLSEMEKFLTLARNSHSYITTVIEKYFKIHNGMRGRTEYYRKIADNLKKLRDSDNTFDHSAENLLKKAESLKIQHEEMLQKFQGEFIKLCKKEKHLKSWENVVLMIFVGAMVGLAIAGIVTAVIAAPSVATAIAACTLPIAMAGHWSITWFEESAKAFKYELEVNEARREETRVAIKELGNIKSSIDGVITQINSVIYNPSSAMDREQIDFTMKAIRSKLGAFLNKVKDLERDVEKARREIRKARDEFISRARM